MSVSDRPEPLTFLYAPAARPQLLAKAMASGADVVIADLEDGVHADAKDSARTTVLEFLDRVAATDGPRPAVHVRVNQAGSDRGRRDLEALAGRPGVDVVRLPKARTAEDIGTARQLLGGSAAPPLHCLVESAAGVENIAAIAGAPGVGGISLGEADLSAELGMTGDEGMSWIRSRLVVAAAAAGLPAPTMSVYVDIADLAGLAASCERGRNVGMRGRAAIHPRQLPTIVAAFTPKADEVARAAALLAQAEQAHADGTGAFRLSDGRFVDAPIVAAARRTVEQWERRT